MAVVNSHSCTAAGPCTGGVPGWAALSPHQHGGRGDLPTQHAVQLVCRVPQFVLVTHAACMGVAMHIWATVENA